jgi:hypothetical protein
MSIVSYSTLHTEKKYNFRFTIFQFCKLQLLRAIKILRSVVFIVLSQISVTTIRNLIVLSPKQQQRNNNYTESTLV